MSASAQAPDAQERRQRVTGILLMMGAVAVFSCIDASSKYLNAYMAVAQVVWARYTFAFLLTLIVSNPITRPGLLHTTRPLLQIGRSLLLVGSTALNIMALRYLQLDQTVSIMFSLPFIIALLSGPLLGEWIDRRRWIAVSVGFLGVLVVTRPGMGNSIHPAAILSVLGLFCYAGYILTTRTLARTDPTDTTLFYSNVVGCVGTTLLLPFFWTTPQSWFVMLIMVAVGFFGALGHFLMIAAHRLAPAPILAPFVYTQIIWMPALGYLIFGDVPNKWTLAGAAIVISSGLYLLFAERRTKVGG